MNLINSDTYASVMRIVSPMLAITFWLISAWFVRYGRKLGVWRRFMGMFAWALNVALFWTVLSYWRLAAGSLPTPWVIPINFWSVVLYFQAAFSMLFGLVFLHRSTLPRGTDSLYSSPTEFGPDDD